MLCFAAILAPDMLNLVACYQSYTVRYIYTNVKHHEFDEAFWVSFMGFEEVAIFFILHCGTVSNHFLCIMQAASDIIKSGIICNILDWLHNVKDDKEFFNSLLEGKLLGTPRVS